MDVVALQNLSLPGAKAGQVSVIRKAQTGSDYFMPYLACLRRRHRHRRCDRLLKAKRMRGAGCPTLLMLEHKIELPFDALVAAD